MFRKALLVSCVLAFCGCSTVRIELEYAPRPEQLPLLSGKTFSLSVVDMRPYVANGRKLPKYLGHTKGLIGVVYSYGTSDQMALIEHVQNDLGRDLQSLGMVYDAQAPSVRLGVRIDDWNFDAGIHGRFWYDAHVTIHRGDGQLVASMPVKGQEVIEGRWGDEARLKAREEMPALYESFIKKLVRENPEVIAAIAQTRPTNQDSPAALLPRSGP